MRYRLLCRSRTRSPRAFAARHVPALAMLVVALGTGVVAAPAVGAVPGTSVTYTLDADFDHGLLVNVNHDAPNNDQLQLNKRSGTFPFIWVALSQRCTIAKINTQTGQILGEYRTIADEAGTKCGVESSRTTVATDGSVWVGHRFAPRVTHVGLEELNQCVDRDNSGTIETSTGYGDVLPWPGAIVNGVQNARDECILHHVDTNPPQGSGDSRHLSVDENGDVWVGNRDGGSLFVKVDGQTGAIMSGPHDLGCGGYGGLSDAQGVIWSATVNGGVLRWDPDAPVVSPNTNLPGANPRCIGVPNYGMAIDSNGSVWTTNLFIAQVSKISPNGNTVQTFSKGMGAFANSQGLAIDGNDDVWISSSLNCVANCTVTHLRNDGTHVGNVPTPTGAGSTGVAVDAAGKVWTANRTSNTATRINPELGLFGCGGSGCGTNPPTRVGEVDLTVDFPAGPGGRPLPLPYNYSDMTGAQLLQTTAPQGTWTVVQDGGAAGMPWQHITWNTEPQGAVPAGSSLVVEARAADTEAGLGGQTYTAVSNGSPVGLAGRFIQVRATLKASDEGDSPILSDLTVVGNRPPVFTETPQCGAPPIEVNAGETVSFPVTGSDPDNHDVTLSASGLPSGATMTPALPVSGNPVTSTFSWSPTPAQEGMHTMTFMVTDPFDAQATCAVSIQVIALTMTGRAYIARAMTTGALASLQTVHIQVQDTGEVSTKVPLTKRHVVPFQLGPVGGRLLDSSVVVEVDACNTAICGSRSTARATAAEVIVNQSGLPKIEATGLDAFSRTTCAGSEGNSRVVKLVVAGHTVPAGDAAPNTTRMLPGGITVILNEQKTGPGVLEVNAVRVITPLAEVTLSSARSDLHDCVRRERTL